jgi:hypothetical protein
MQVPDWPHLICLVLCNPGALAEPVLPAGLCGRLCQLSLSPLGLGGGATELRSLIRARFSCQQQQELPAMPQLRELSMYGRIDYTQALLLLRRMPLLQARPAASTCPSLARRELQQASPCLPLVLVLACVAVRGQRRCGCTERGS